MTTTPHTNVLPFRPAPSRHELEASLEAYFNKRIRLMGGRAVKLAPTEKGLPDRLVLLPGGRVYLCELKADTGRTSAAQDLWHQRSAELGTRVQLLVGRAGIDKWLREKGAEIDPQPATRANTPRGRGYSSK